MSEHKSVYAWSLKDALHYGERDLWRESYKENCDCARAIERAIADNYRDNVLHDCAADIISRYGFNRVNWVLANTIQQKADDGRFYDENKKWAKKLYIPNDDVRWHFTVESHPGLTNLFVCQARQAWDALHLFDASHCLPDDENQDYTGKIVVIDPMVLKDEYKTPDSQLFLAEGGFGAHPHSRGTKVFGRFLDTGEETHFARTDILGVLQEDLIPEWAKYKVAELSAPAHNDEISMGGM